jgi:hypothetical protein
MPPYLALRKPHRFCVPVAERVAMDEVAEGKEGGIFSGSGIDIGGGTRIKVVF